ncbi:MAG TPA: cyclic 2,3-diphosphoglycerate synthase [Nitrososphaerales archaeon]|nr:cyclic 2,3-diphosphoglycerate synthase [Nitrososphaerales archaeon]
MRRVIILGAAGRDFHNFLTFYKNNPHYRVVAFTATQIPGIEKRNFPSKLAGRRYPDGIPIFQEEKLPSLIKELRADEVVLAYSDLTHLDVMHKASIALASGASFGLLGPSDTMLHSKKPVIAVCAVRTGAGKSPATRRISLALRDMGYRVGIIRHPMPYGDLAKEAVQNFSTFDDLDKEQTTIEEREEYESHIANGFSVYAGVDYASILKLAEKSSDVIIFDGGNNDFSFIRPDLLFVIADARRPGHELTYHPGEANVRMADYIIVNKIDAASKENRDQVIENVKQLNRRAEILQANLKVSVESPEAVRGARVLCVEDGPTLTHGGLPTGAAFRVATENKASEIVDPRKYAVGSITEVFRKFSHLGNVLPAMGYGEKQMKELKETIDGTNCDLVLIGTPVDLRRDLKLTKPTLRVTYEMEEVGELTITKVLEKYRKTLDGNRSADLSSKKKNKKSS